MPEISNRFPKRVYKRVILGLCLALLFTLCACSGRVAKMNDGYYTAEARYYDDHGWKEVVTIYVMNDTIVTVEYNAYNPSGFIKSWDMRYMRQMNEINGTYPNEYTRLYADMLQTSQSPAEVDVISGATHSYYSFVRLSQAAIEQALAGDRQVAFVTIPAPIAEQAGGHE